MSVEEALGRGTHLLITGEPGAGKSTLSQMYVQRLAKVWLEASGHPPLPEPVLPLRVPAKALADELPWSELLANAVRDRRLNASLNRRRCSPSARSVRAGWCSSTDWTRSPNPSGGPA